MRPTVRVKHSEIKASSNDSENFRIHTLHPANEIGRTSESQGQSQSDHITIGVPGVSEPQLRNASVDLSQYCTECSFRHVQSIATTTRCVGLFGAKSKHTAIGVMPFGSEF
jgi:hypothetical protein